MPPAIPGRRAFSVAIFARHQGRVLLIFHRRLQKWLPVGGEIHDGETPIEAARRELLEETSLTGQFASTDPLDGAPAGLIGYEEHSAGSKGLHMNFAFVCDVESAEVRPNDEFGEFRWIASADGLEAPLNVRQLVERALAAPEPELTRVARAWLSAFNGRDLDRLLSLYDENAVHTSPKLRDRRPETEGKVRGKAALRAWWADAMQRLPNLRYAEQHLTASGERVFMEYLRTVPGEPDLVVAEVLVVRGGKIVESAVFHG